MQQDSVDREMRSVQDKSAGDGDVLSTPAFKAYPMSRNATNGQMEQFDMPLSIHSMSSVPAGFRKRLREEVYTKHPPAL